MRERKIILASTSPRRHALLLEAGIPHSVLACNVDERPCEPYDPVCGRSYPEWYADAAARVKSAAALHMIQCDLIGRSPDDASPLIITADTVVSPDGAGIFGKPEDRGAAEKMLRALSGGRHTVIGGICVTDGTSHASALVTTSVYFRVLDEPIIQAYLNTGEYVDKAGAYAIQGRASRLVAKIDGDYSNVVGISIAQLDKILSEEFGYTIPF